MSLEIVPMTLREANRFVQHHHRHHRPDRGCVFTLGCEQEGELVGVAIVGRPKGRGIQDGKTAEVTRLCTLDSERARHAASKLYRRAWKAAAAIGYHRLITYTLATESGASLRGAGFRVAAERVRGRSWDTPSRHRSDSSPAQFVDKTRWEIAL